MELYGIGSYQEISLLIQKNELNNIDARKFVKIIYLQLNSDSTG